MKGASKKQGRKSLAMKIRDASFPDPKDPNTRSWDTSQQIAKYGCTIPQMWLVEFWMNAAIAAGKEAKATGLPIPVWSDQYATAYGHMLLKRIITLDAAFFKELAHAFSRYKYPPADLAKRSLTDREWLREKLNDPLLLM